MNVPSHPHAHKLGQVDRQAQIHNRNGPYSLEQDMDKLGRHCKASYRGVNIRRIKKLSSRMSNALIFALKGVSGGEGDEI